MNPFASLPIGEYYCSSCKKRVDLFPPPLSQTDLVKKIKEKLIGLDYVYSWFPCPHCNNGWAGRFDIRTCPYSPTMEVCNLNRCRAYIETGTLDIHGWKVPIGYCKFTDGGAADLRSYPQKYGGL